MLEQGWVDRSRQGCLSLNWRLSTLSKLLNCSFDNKGQIKDLWDLLAVAWSSHIRAVLRVTDLRCRPQSAKVSVFCEHLWFSAVACALHMIEFPGQGVNLRISAIFCENLRFGPGLSPQVCPLKCTLTHAKHEQKKQWDPVWKPSWAFCWCWATVGAFLLNVIYTVPTSCFRMSEKGGYKRGGHFMAILAVLAACSELFFWNHWAQCWSFWIASAVVKGFSNDTFPHFNSAPPKHDCHWFTFISLMNLAFCTKLRSQEGWLYW